jgi:fumarate hydratase class I
MNAPASPPTVLLTVPCDADTVRALPLGASVRLSGTIYTGRDRLHRFLFDGGAPPVSLSGGALFHCGPVVLPEAGGGWRVVAAGPTTSIREEPYMAAIITRHGLRAIIGKGGMGHNTQAACREHGCVYIQTVGGAAAWIAQCVRRVGRVWFEREFGATEAMWELDIEGLIGRVAIDARGESLFTRVEQESGARLRRLIAGQTEGA